jgi:NitT/TauT family transport system substrate-binding protein
MGFEGETVMRIAIPDYVSSTFFPLLVAKELRLFEQEGQDVVLVAIPAPAHMQALRDRAVEMSAATAHSPMLTFPESRGAKLVATVSRGTPWMLVMRAGLAKRGELEAVKGRRIAADWGPQLVFRHLLREAGIDIERDRVEIAPPTDSPDLSFGVAAATALAEGKVAGLWANVLGCEVAVHLQAGSVVIDTRRGDGPPGAGNYSFAALAATESYIVAEPERIGAAVRALARAQSVIREDRMRAREVARRLFPAVEAELMGHILTRDAEFYRPSISTETIEEMNRFARAVGLLSSAVPYEQLVATQFQSAWSE